MKKENVETKTDKRIEKDLPSKTEEFSYSMLEELGLEVKDNTIAVKDK